MTLSTRFRLATLALAGRTLTGCAMSSPVDVFKRWRRPSLEITYSDAGPPNALLFPRVPRAPAPAADGTGITGIAVRPPGHAAEELACASFETNSRCFCQNILPRSA